MGFPNILMYFLPQDIFSIPGLLWQIHLCLFFCNSSFYKYLLEEKKKTLRVCSVLHFADCRHYLIWHNPELNGTQKSHFSMHSLPCAFFHLVHSLFHLSLSLFLFLSYASIFYIHKHMHVIYVYKYVLKSHIHLCIVCIHITCVYTYIHTHTMHNTNFTCFVYRHVYI